MLTGTRRIACSRRLEFDPARITRYNPDGRFVVDQDVLPPAGWVAPFTQQQLDERFTLRPPPAHDDAELWERFQAKLGIKLYSSLTGRRREPMMATRGR